MTYAIRMCEYAFLCTRRHTYMYVQTHVYIYASICICMSGCSPSAKDGLYPKGSTVLAAAEHRAKQVVSVVARAWA